MLVVQGVEHGHTEANPAKPQVSGMNQSFYANQLIELLESKMLAINDERLMERLRHLHTLLDDVLVAEAA